MTSYLSNSLFFFSVVLIVIVCEFKSTNAQIKYVVTISDQLPNNPSNLTCRCQSKDDDIGYHTLHPGDSFEWKFRTNFQGTTLFFCHFWWGAKQASFVVYNYSMGLNYCNSDYFHRNQCLWNVKEDAFYLNKVVGKHRGWTKMYDWQN